MSHHVYKKLELVGSSETSIEDAVQIAITAASGSVHNMRWFEIAEVRGEIADNKVAHYQVTLKVGFTVEE